MKPNLFTYATSELSQDAILIWLINWAKPDYHNVDELLHDTGKYFLKTLLQKAGISVSTFNKINVRAQYHKIDIFIELEIGERKFAIIIEDKVSSSEHSNQLERYTQFISNIGYEREQIIPIYLKTKFQHNFDNVLKQGYHVYSVHDLMDVLKYGKSKGVKNEIFLDFFDHLRQLEIIFQEDESSYLNYGTKLIKDWNWWNWIGFFDNNRATLNAEWGIVPNRRENLVALYFGGTNEKVVYNNVEIIVSPYIDVKYSSNNYYTFSYRLGLNGHPQNDRRLRDEIIRKLEGKIRQNGIMVKIPKFTKAKQTIELLKVTNINGEMNEKETVSFLKRMQKALVD